MVTPLPLPLSGPARFRHTVFVVHVHVCEFLLGCYAWVLLMPSFARNCVCLFRAPSAHLTRCIVRLSTWAGQRVKSRLLGFRVEPLLGSCISEPKRDGFQQSDTMMQPMAEVSKVLGLSLLMIRFDFLRHVWLLDFKPQ